MKSLKKVLAALLAAVIVITGGAFAFANNAETVIEWTMEEDYTFEALYAGEAKEGTFTIKAMEEYEDVYYTFNAEKAGYYSISYDWYPVDYCMVAETFAQGKATGDRKYVYTEDNDNAVFIYYFDEGVNYVGFNLYTTESYDSYAKIEFIGEEITNVVFDEKEIETLLIDVEIYTDEDKLRWWTDVEIVFDGSKTVSCKENALTFDINTPVATGEVELTLNVINYSKDYVATVYKITDVVTNVRVVEESSKEVEILYDGTINSEKLDGMTLETTFSNGEKVTDTIEYGSAEVEFPNGKIFYFDVYYDYEEDEIYLNVVFPCVNSEMFFHEKCQPVEASKEANRETLKENISYPFKLSNLFFRWDMSDLEYAGTFGQVIGVFFNAFGNAAVNFEWAFNNLFGQLFAYLAYSLSF